MPFNVTTEMEWSVSVSALSSPCICLALVFSQEDLLLIHYEGKKDICLCWAPL